MGRLFQARRPATKKALSPNDRRVDEFSALPVSVRRSKPLLGPTEDVSAT